MTEPEFQKLRAEVTAITVPVPALLTYYLLTLCLTVLGIVVIPIAFLPLYFRYHTMRYRFDDTGVFKSYGILFRKEMQLTWARMQDIHLSQNIAQRWLGIGTVTVQTAGSGESANLEIEGVEQFEAIRDYLYARMRGVRHDAPPAESTSEQSALLIEIRDALKASAEALRGAAK